MLTGLWIPTAGCPCWRCRAAVSFRKLGITFAVGILVLVVLAVLTLVGCATTYTPSRPPPGPGTGGGSGGVRTWTLQVEPVTTDGQPIADAEVSAVALVPPVSATGKTDGAGHHFWLSLKEAGYTVCAKKAGFHEACTGVTLTQSRDGNKPVRIVLERQGPIVVPGRGQVVADAHVLRDDGGPRLYWGTTLFWGLWGELHDVPKLDANLKTASEAGADYVRVLAQVGPGGWTDRTVQPTDAGWQAAIRSFTDRAYDRFGLRVQWTIFGAAENIPDAAEDRAVAGLLDAIEGRHAKVWAIEIGNESFQNEPGPARAKALAAKVRARFLGLVATSAPDGDSCVKQAEWYQGSTASLVTLHTSRAQTGGPWRPVRQPWRESTFSCAGITKAYANNEPIGPRSSVAADDNSLRLVMQAVVSWTGGMGAYVFHTDAGIRGGGVEDRLRGRVANFAEVTNWTATTQGLQTARSLLPADLPNWSRGSSRPPMFDVATFAGPSGPGTIDRLYCAWRGGEFVCAGFNIVAPTRLTAKRALSVKVMHPLTGVVLQDVTLPNGGTVTLGTDPAGVILRGVFR